MSDIKIKAEELEDFASQIGKAERECEDALDAINWHFSSLLANFPGVVPGSIHNLEADLKYSIKKYKSKLDDAQQLIKLTAANMKNDEQKMSVKVGEFLLELVGWYDIQRVFSEYDPITGEKLSAGDRVLAVGFLALTFVPPAKAAGVGGKAAVKGVKAGLPSLAKSPEAFMKIRNVLDPKKVQQAFRSVYNEVVKGPIVATKVWFDKVKKGIGDIPVPQIRQEAFAGVGVVNKTVKDAFGEAKDYIQRIKSSQVDEVDVKGVTKGTGNVSKKVVYGDQFTKVDGKKALKPDIEYTTNEGYHYKTDSNGRISSAEAKLQLGKAERNQYAQRIVGGKDRLSNDDGGHLIASIFKGSGDIDNLVPMNATLNRSEYKTLENAWRKALQEGGEVAIKVKPKYDGNSLRPSEFKINYTIDGKKYSDRLTNYVGGKIDGD